MRGSSDESGSDRVSCDVQARGEVRSRDRLDVVLPKGVWNCMWRGVGQQIF